MASLPNGVYQQALAAADVLLVNEHSGLREMAVPSKLTSYLTSGRPIVAATDQDSLSASEIRASGAGIRVEPGAAGELLDAVFTLRDDRDRATALGRRGLQHQTEVLSEDRAIAQFEGWLTALAV